MWWSLRIKDIIGYVRRSVDERPRRFDDEISRLIVQVIVLMSCEAVGCRWRRNILEMSRWTYL
jgi:hypothetical protein